MGGRHKKSVVVIQSIVPMGGEECKPRPAAARLRSGSLADFLTRKDLADFLLEALLDFLAVGFASSVYNILSYLLI